MPTLQNVNREQMSALWLVLQHAQDADVRKKYFPLIEKSVQNNDLKKEYFALMKDRILMHDGEEQIYGSQIKNGKLYKLKDPQYVNVRRKEMGMEPIEEYLKKFKINFSIHQQEVIPK